MGIRKAWKYFVRHLKEKHRLSLRNQRSDREVWYMHISPLNLLTGLFALLLLLFFVVTLAVAYTPILDMIPGYPGNKSRALLVENIMRLDSLERELNNMQVYSENVALIMAGKHSVTRNTPNSDTLSKTKPTMVGRIPEDSVLRSQMESPVGEYSLGNIDQARNRQQRSALELFTPVKGVVTTGFEPLSNHFGVGIATTVHQPVMSVMDGVVIAASWIPQDGYTLFVQHPDNLVSVYRHNVEVLKKGGDRVRGGEVIGYTGSDTPAAASVSSNLFEFELWHNGTPVDPQGYIVF